MSGGSWDYLCWKVEDAVIQLQKSKDPLRRAFGEHLQLCANALHDIEWVDSSDMSHGDDRVAIELALGDAARQLEMEVLLRDARELIHRLQEFVGG